VYPQNDSSPTGLCPSSGTLQKPQRFGNFICFRPQVEREEARTRVGCVWMRKFQTLDNLRKRPVERIFVNLTRGSSTEICRTTSNCV
jgi:hypothetical protein